MEQGCILTHAYPYVPKAHGINICASCYNFLESKTDFCFQEIKISGSSKGNFLAFEKQVFIKNPSHVSVQIITIELKLGGTFLGESFYSTGAKTPLSMVAVIVQV